MEASEAPWNELKRARKAIDDMRSASQLQEFEESWKDALRAFERLCNKLQNHYQKSPKWSQWWAPYNKHRTKDPLLRYLKQARNADEHSVAPIAQHQPSALSVGVPPGVGAVYIRHLGFENGRITVDASGPLAFDITPERMKLLPVVNYGTHFDVPTAHLGAPIDPDDVCGIAELAFSYYEKLVINAERSFCGQS